MTRYSENGWPVHETAPSFVSARVTGRLDPEAAKTLEAFASRFNAEVEKIDKAQSWGWANRNIIGSSTTISNHASGSAIDLNAEKHPLGKSGTYTGEQIAKLRVLLQEYSDIRWGGDYAGRKDEMHFEMKPGTYKRPAAETVNPKLTVDGYWGVETTKALQKLLGTTVDGLVSGQYSSARENCLVEKSWKFVQNPSPNGSPLVKAVQKWVNAPQDGFFGNYTKSRLAERLGQDKWRGTDSVKLLQSYLNQH